MKLPLGKLLIVCVFLAGNKYQNLCLKPSIVQTAPPRLSSISFPFILIICRQWDRCAAYR